MLSPGGCVAMATMMMMIKIENRKFDLVFVRFSSADL
jgi:hypothetical protein